jgi:hypothetical protein
MHIGHDGALHGMGGSGRIGMGNGNFAHTLPGPGYCGLPAPRSRNGGTGGGLLRMTSEKLVGNGGGSGGRGSPWWPFFFRLCSF